MSVEIEKLNESFLRVNCGDDIALNLSEHFSFYTEGYKWSPKYKAGIWDGKIRLFQKRGRLLPIGLGNDLIVYFRQNGIDFENKIENTYGPNLSAKFIKKFCSELLKCEYEPRDYQISAIQQALKYKKIILLSATGSGKSYIAYILLNLLKYMNDDFRSLLVVPTSSLVYQMKEDFIEYGKNFCNMEDFIHIIKGKEKNSNKPIIISTWQAIQSHNISPVYFSQFNGIICDEVHGATASQLSKIVNNCVNASFKIGMTGSLKECTTSKMQLKALFSKVYSASSTKKLQKKKILSQLEIRNCVLNYPEKMRKECKKLNYVDEISYIRNIKSRKKIICNLVKKAKGNSLILFRSIEYGKEIFEMIKKTNVRTFYIFGGTNVEDRESARKIAEKYDNVIIVASVGVFSTGVNIKRLHNLFFVESIKSTISIIQSLGRVLRVHETKKKAILWDIVDDLQQGKRKNYVLKHFFQRIKIYNDQGFNYLTKTFKLE